VPVALQTAQPSPDRPRRKGELTAERILDVAEELFAERGYAGTTLRAVATRVGLRIPSLYNHFPGKEALYVAVLERGLGPVLAVLSEFLDAETDAYRDSGRVVERVMDLLARRPNLPRLIQRETLAGGERLTPVLRDWMVPAFARAHEMVEATPAAARWGTDQTPLLVLAMYHIVVGYFAIAPLYHELADEDLLAEAAVARQKRFLAQVVDALFDRS